MSLMSPFHDVPHGPAETELMDGARPLCCHVLKTLTLLSQAINIPIPLHLRKALKTWSREDLHVRVFQGVRTGGPKARQVCCRETFDMETGSLLAREYFDPGKGPTRLPSPALPDCSLSSSHSMCVRSVFWYSEVDPVPETIRAVAAQCRARASASRNEARRVVALWGEGVSAHAQAREAYVQKNGGVEEMSSASAREAPLLKSGVESRVTSATTEHHLVMRRPEREETGWN